MSDTRASCVEIQDFDVFVFIEVAYGKVPFQAKGERSECKGKASSTEVAVKYSAHLPRKRVPKT